MDALTDRTGSRWVGPSRSRSDVEKAGERLVAGRYRIQSQLGRGSMGVVWLAQDEVLRRPVALKQVIPRDQEPGEVLTSPLARALSEARAAASVRHRGVVAIHDLVEDDGLAWIVMERLSGRTLQEALDAEGPLPVGDVARLGLCLLDALGATHQAGFVHCDVKPSNVYLCDSGRVVLTDFGISRGIDGEATVPNDEFIGSPAYVAPERIDIGLERCDVGPTSDLFSLGATLFAAVEGEPPFRRGSILATIFAVVEDPPGPFLRAGALRPVIEGLLTKRPERRPSPDATRAALEAARAGAAPRSRSIESLSAPPREMLASVAG